MINDQPVRRPVTMRYTCCNQCRDWHGPAGHRYRFTASVRYYATRAKLIALIIWRA